MKPSIKRFFQPLEEWIYLKIYINPISSNFVLAKYIQPIVKEMYPDISTKWFFIRYKDTHYHLRLRFWIPNASELDNGMRIICCHLKRAVEDGYVHRWSIDGYERELERYGIENILITEEYFCISSFYLANAVWMVANNNYLINCLVLSMMHIFLINFLPNLEDRILLCEKNMKSLYSEFGLCDCHIKYLNKRCRSYRKFTDILTTNTKQAIFSEKVNNLMEEYKNRLESLSRKMSIKTRRSLNLSSIIHLDVNRAYEIDARRIELALYYILYKAYCSDRYRKKC